MPTRRDFLKLAATTAVSPSLLETDPFLRQASVPDVFADFESGTYNGWTLSGNCWTQEPHNGKTISGITGFQGRRFLCTLHPALGNNATGKAVSREFIIGKPIINFLIGGGNYPGKACLNLVVDGEVVRSATGNDKPELRPASWDVSQWIGRKAHFEVVDATSSRDRGYIMVDEISFASLPSNQAPVVSYDGPFIKLKLRFLQFADNDGTAVMGSGGLSQPMNSAQVRKTVEGLNVFYKQAGIEFQYDDSVPVHIIRDSKLFRGMDMSASIDIYNKDVKPTGFDDDEIYTPWALSGEKGVLVIARRGNSWYWDSRKAKWQSLRDAARGGLESVRVVLDASHEWAHELGHLFGLPHTFASKTLHTVQDIQSEIDQYKMQHPDRNPLEAIDGDLRIGITDSTPDPGEQFWKPGYYKDTIKLRVAGTELEDIYIDKVNVMGYNGGGYLSPQQISLLRSNARFWKMSGDRFPLNKIPAGAILCPATRMNLSLPTATSVRMKKFSTKHGGSDFIEVAPKIGSLIKFTFTPPSEGRYRVSFVGSRGLDHALCKFSISPDCFQEFDLWSGGPGGIATRLPTGLLTIGETSLKQESIQLTIEIKGKAPISWGTVIGIQGVVLERLT